MAVITFLIVIYAGYQAAQLVLADDVTTLELLAIVAAGGAVIVAILNDWRRGLYALVGWILFEDIVRKYLGNNMMIYFGKDVLALVLYLSFFRARRHKIVDKLQLPFRVALLLFVWFSAIQVFNPASNSMQPRTANTAIAEDAIVNGPNHGIRWASTCLDALIAFPRDAPLVRPAEGWDEQPGTAKLGPSARPFAPSMITALRYIAD